LGCCNIDGEELREKVLAVEYFDLIKKYDYEQISIIQNKKAKLFAIDSIHDTTRGPAVGGTRFMKYKSEEDALIDALKLSRAMTYKNAAAGLTCGGGKTVIMEIEGMDRKLAFQTVGRYIESLHGRRFTGRDLGVSTEDIDVMRTETKWVADETPAGVGNLSEATAFGVLQGIRACLAEAYGNDSLKGRHIAVQGVGEVGYWVVKYAIENGSKVTIADINKNAIEKATKEFPATVVAPDQIYDVDCDIFSPCALGGIINSETVKTFKCKVIAGSANNALATNEDGIALFNRGILYATDYIVNAGALIQWWYRQKTFKVKDRIDARDAISNLYNIIRNVLRESKEKKLAPFIVADQYAESKLKKEKTYVDFNWGYGK
jgi:leucine dehydrogenase